jgi:predicted NBD/HSP70 family sugar kinase
MQIVIPSRQMDASSDRRESAEAAGRLFAIIRDSKASSRPGIERVSGLSRVTVVQRLRYLFEAGLVVEGEATEASGGRPARIIRPNPDFAMVLAADVGESKIRVAATDLTPRIIAETTIDLDVASGPKATLTEIVRAARKLASDHSRLEKRKLGVGLSLPAPVNHVAGKVVGPSVMRGWDDFDVCGFLAGELGVPALVDNDVNLMALSEYRQFWPGVGHFLFVKAGTGIGSGIILNGAVYRGAHGASGDIGHIQFDEVSAPLCRCGKFGCVEARAAGWAIARDLRTNGFTANDARDVINLLEQREPDCIQRVREAGRVLGEVTADVVSVLNPKTIVVGGTLARAGEHLLAGVKELIYRRSLPLALDGLGIFSARSDDRAGILGAAHLVIDAALAPEALSGTIECLAGAEVKARRGTPPHRHRRSRTSAFSTASAITWTG